MRVKLKNGVRVFEYSNDLETAIKKAEKELDNRLKDEKIEHLEYMRNYLTKILDSHFRRVDDLESFIRLGKDKLNEKIK